MESSRNLQVKIVILGLHLCVAALSFSHCDARRSMHLERDDYRHPRSGSIIRRAKRIQVSKRFDIDSAQLDDSNTEPNYGVSSPFSLPPYESLAPMPLPENAPPYCTYPPFTSQPPPSTTIPFPPPTGGSGGGGGSYTPSLPPPSSFSTPTLPFLTPPPSPEGSGGGVSSPPQSIPSPIPNPPQIVPSPPTSVVPSPPPGSVVSGPPTFVPSPTQPVFSPPYYFEPSPPSTVVPNPPFSVPSGPSIFVPSPPVFQPPVVYPPPAVPPPPRTTPFSALWCVSKPTVPDPIIQEAMNYACASGGDCDSIQPNGSCFQPNTLLAHASYAFNSYWQRTKVAGGTCEFGGTAMLVTVDPSYDGCHFVYY
ncbi:leucine-rich repeat extensin-like protein 5 [Rhododendron vialii]|uniref:leucine-rich repeat extensin-like protein 5 n=1 Tax=Rhododendron vialii TaxID=182163 RepID=UPI00265DC83D|nr:leucine-rich repeat extensin-like protein 5 [Rhododendron vialii]